MTKKCVVCGREFEAETSRKCCSLKCSKARIKLMRKKARDRRNIENPKEKISKICRFCGARFEVSRQGRGLQSRIFCPACSLKKKRLLRSAYYRGAKDIRASGRVYTNTPERLAEIKAKYSRGIPEGEIEAWLS